MTSAIEQQLKRIKREAEEREVKRQAERNNKVPYLNPQNISIPADVLKLIDNQKIVSVEIIPLDKKGNNVSLGVVNPRSANVQEVVSLLKKQGYNISLFQISQSSFNELINRYLQSQEQKERPSQSIKQSKAILDLSDIAAESSLLSSYLSNLNHLNPVRRLIAELGQHPASTSEILAAVLIGAVNNRASDIHLEPAQDQVRVRYRIDGILKDISQSLTKDIYLSLLSRIKLISGLKINITTNPQDGRFSFKIQNREIEVRVSAVPSQFGETIVMRLLDPLIADISLQDLGFRSDDLKIVLREIYQPDGMVLAAGPTGSGKTTTLYSFLKKRHSPEVKIITIEDPIEYHLEGVEQTQVNSEEGYDFANGLAAIMRQDPDIILVGEIRDNATASTAIQAALTGHLVFSTVHANKAAAVIPRLLSLGADATTIVPAVNLIIAQRLVRRLCPSCKEKVELEADQEAKIRKFLNNLPPQVGRSDYDHVTIFKAGSCKECEGSGYRGRIGIFELLEVKDRLKQLDPRQFNEQSLERFVAVTVQEDGILKVLKGITDFQEIERATGPLML